MQEMWKGKQVREDAREMHRTDARIGFFLENHDLVRRRVDRQGKVLIWCRKCSGCARQRMGPKLMNCRMSEPMGIKELWQDGENNPNTRGSESSSMVKC